LQLEEYVMKERLEEIGSRLRELRELSNITTEDMAEYLDITAEAYSCYEQGKLDIPASKLIEIARKFDVDMSLLLTGDEPRMNIFSVTRKGHGVEVERRKQYRYQSLAGNFIHKKAEPFIVTVEPRKDKPSFNSHPGQEFDFVLAGTLKLYIHDRAVMLNEGDSIFFDSSYKPALEAVDDKPAQLLVVVM
jgi:transcriptional regulator with XRE-family HTH domain